MLLVTNQSCSLRANRSHVLRLCFFGCETFEVKCHFGTWVEGSSISEPAPTEKNTPLRRIKKGSLVD